MTRAQLVKVLTVVVVVAGSASLAGAGYKESYGVTVNRSSHYAAGSLSGTRNSANSTEFLFCELSGYYNEATPFLFCWAQDWSGQSAYCISRSTTLIQIATSVADTSFLNFRWDDSGGCTYLGVANQSYQPPKLP